VHLAVVGLVASIPALVTLIPACDAPGEGDDPSRAVQPQGLGPPVLPSNHRERSVAPPADLTIGTFEGEGPEVFGIIGDLAVDDAGRIYALDTRLQVVRVFSPNGEFLGEAGRPGRGPGEFSVPTGLAVLGSALLVLDAANTRMSVFHVTDSIAHELDVQLRLPGWDLCRLGDTVFVLAGSPRAAVHRFRAAGSALEPDGQFDVDGPEDPLLAATLRPSIIACLDDGRTVAVATPQLPAVTLYRSDGREVAKHEIADFVQVRVERGDDGSVALQWPSADRWHHVITSVFPLDGSEFGVQVAVIRAGARDASEVSDFETRVMRADRGEIRRVPSAARTLVVRDNVEYGVRTEPHPQIVVQATRLRPSTSEHP